MSKLRIKLLLLLLYALSNDIYAKHALNTEFFKTQIEELALVVVSSIEELNTTAGISNIEVVEYSCMTTESSTDIPKTISATTATTITSTIVVSESGTINDINLNNLDISHSYIDDIIVTLTSPNNTAVVVLNKPCNGQNNVLMDLDDEAASGSFPCPPTNGQAYQPVNSLTAFDGEEVNGTWTISIQDVYGSADGGSLNGWDLEIDIVCPSVEICDNGIDDDGDGDIDGADSECNSFSCASGLLSNPDFESGSTGWIFQSNTSISNDAYFGTNAAYANGGAGGPGQDYAASVGEIYTLSVYAKKNASESSVVGIKFYDAGWTELEATYTEVTSSTYEVYYLALIAPANTVWVQATGWKNAGSGEAWWDGFCLEEWSDASPPSCTNTSCTISPDHTNYNWALDDSGTDAHWMEYDNGGLILCDNDDGTLSIKGNLISGRDASWGSGIAAPCGAQDGWLIDFTLSDMQSWAEFGGSYEVEGACPNAYQNLDYWDVTGTLTGIGCNSGRTMTFTPSTGYRLQIGVGGNSHTCDFGMSTWFAGMESGNSVKADIYAHLDSTCYMSMRPSPTGEICDNNIDDDGDGLIDEIVPFEVSTNIGFWLRADKNLTTSGSNISAWGDQTDNGNNATQSTSTYQPILISDAINGEPVVSFDGSNDYLNFTTTSAQTEATVFFILNGQIGGSSSVLMNDGTTSLRYEQWSSTGKYGFTRYGVADYTSTINTTFNEPVLLQFDKIAASTTVNIQETKNGIKNSANLTIGSASYGFPVGTLGKSSGSPNAQMAEVIFYNSVLTNSETNKIETYLSIKYGIDLPQTSYFNPYGSVLFAYTSYDNDNAGIGRHDCSDLNKTASKSINSDALVTISNPSSLDELDFLIWGNDNGSSNTFTTTGAPASYELLERVWRVDETGDVGTVTISVPSSLFGGASPFIVIDTDNDGSFSDETPIAMAQNGFDYEAQNVNFTADSRFTFARSSATEICNNGIDDDGDGDIDNADVDCCSNLSLVAQNTWSLHFVDSEETASGDRSAGNAFDGFTNTLWHTRWSDVNPNDPLPHEIQIDLGNTNNIAGFRYLPRQDGSPNGRIGSYEFYTSLDGSSWGTAVVNGTWTYIDATEKEVTFSPINGRYIRLRATSEANANQFISMAEINVLECAGSSEICDNGVDDDGDGLIDGNDPDCIDCPMGSISYERWTGVSGGTISDLTGNANYPNNPNESGLFSDFQGPNGYAENYGTRIRGFIYPPETGNYTFIITSDDASELYLSTNENPNNKVSIASVSDYTGVTEFTKHAAQTSNAIALQMGGKYYVELLHKESGGGDHVQVYWKTPSKTGETIIDGSYLSPWSCSVEICNNSIDDDNDGLTDCNDPDCGPSASSNYTNPSCGINNGTITITAANGTGSYEYQLNSGTWQSNNTFTGLSVGSYSINVRNDDGTCTISVGTLNLAESCVEICDNAIDDDSDGLIDGADPDCGACEETILYVARDAGKFLEVNLNTGLQSIATTSPYTSSNLNAIAANPDAGVVYYGIGQSVHYWNPATDIHGTLANFSAQFGAADQLSNGGAAYYDGYLYMGTEDGNPGSNPKVYRVPVSADGLSTTGSAVNLNIPIYWNTSWGDLIVSTEGGYTVIYGGVGNNNGSNSTYFKYFVEVSTYSVISSSMIQSMQISADVNGNIWVAGADGSGIRQIDKATGNYIGAEIGISGRKWDLTGPANCAQIVEICDNGIDDDGDGLTDCYDPDCSGLISASADVPKTISTSGASTITSTLNVTESGTIQDIDVLDLDISHSYINDLTITLTSPAGTVVNLINKICAGQQNIHVQLNDEATSSNFACPPNNGQAYQPNGSLSAYDGENINGVWTLTVSDDFAGDGGSLNRWALKMVTTCDLEICDNSIDDDGDGLIDCADPDCNNNLTVNANATQASICNGASTAISASASGGDGSFTYSWSHSLGNGSSKTVSPTATTTYTVTVTDGNGCTDTDQVAVTVNNLPTVTASSNVSICNGSNTAISASATGGSGSGYTYSWSHSLGNGTSKTVSPSVTTIYTVTLTDGNGCTDTDQVTITVNSCSEICDNGIDDDGDSLIDCADPDCSNGLAVTAALSQSTICNGNNSTLSASASGGDANYTFSWDNSLPNGNSHLINPSSTTTYQVTVTDGNGCIATDQITITINTCSEICDNGIDDDGDGLIDCADNDCSVVSVSLSEDCLINGIDLTASGGTMPYTYTWSDMPTPNAHWTFENTTDDVSGNGNHENTAASLGTVAYSADAVQGQNALSLDGSTYLRYSIDGAFMETAFTQWAIACWIKPSGLSGLQTIIDEGGSTNGIAVRLNNTTLEFAARDNSVQINAGSHTFPNDGGWHHIAAVYANDSLKLFLDGVQGTATFAGFASSEVSAHSGNGGIGYYDSGSGFGASTTDYYTGLIDDFNYFYNQSLTADQIADIARNDGDRTNLVGGTYTVTVQDSDGGCPAIEAINVIGNCTEICDNGIDDDGDGLIDCADPDCSNGLTVTAILTQAAICNGDNADLSASASGGDGNYTFSWDNSLPNGNTHNVSPSSSTTYNVTVTDGNGCMAIDQIILTVNTCIEICDNGIDDDFDGMTDCDDTDCSPDGTNIFDACITVNSTGDEGDTNPEMANV